MTSQTGHPFRLAPQTLVDAVRDQAIFLLDSGGKVISSNQAVASVTGYAAAELHGRQLPFWKIVQGLHPAGTLSSRETVASPEKFEAEAWLMHKQGHSFRARVRRFPLPQSAGSGYLLMVRDVTAEFEALETLRQSERQFRTLVDGVVDYAIFMLDAEGVITNWNSGAQRIKGYTASDIIGQHFSVFYTEEDRAHGLPARSLASAIRHGQFESEGWRVRKDGSRFWANVVLDPIHGPDGTLLGFAKITRDITEQRKTQMALEETRAELAHAQRMESIGQLTGGIAHDFNNLLTGMIGSLELLKQLMPEEARPRLERYADAALAAAHRAASLTHRLLAFARRQPLAPQPVNANTLVRSLAELFRRTLGENIALEFNTASDLWLTRCDPHQLENALLNLVINARDAMPDGGTLTISTRNAPCVGERTARLHDVAPGEYVCIAVSDNGAGMPPEVAARAFDPFFTTKPVGAGTGLGLSMVHGFTRQSEGFVHLKSRPGAGTCIELYLPRFSGEAALPPEERHSSASVEGAGFALLVVEDEPAVRYLIVEVLQQSGFIVHEAGDSAAALRILQSPKHLDLMITDVGLPGLNGRDLADQALALRPSLPILFMTGYAESAISSNFLKPGMEMLTKPFTLNSLLRKVDHILNGGMLAPSREEGMRR